MGKKLIMAAMSIAAMAAFIVPAAANASVIEFGSGGAVPTGTEITGTANNTSPRLVTTTDLGTLECTSIMLSGELTENSGGNVKGIDKPGQSVANECSFEEVEPVKVTLIDLKGFSSLAGETGTGHFEVSYTARIPGGVECKFATKSPGALFHYAVGGDLVEITPTNVTVAGCGLSILEGDLTIEARTSNGSIDNLVLN